MNDTTKAAALEAARKNELHASHGTMEVKAASAEGVADVLCACGVMLRVAVNVEAPTAKPAEAPKDRHVPRRMTVQDDDPKGGG